LGETAKVYGTSFTLNYRSSRLAGNKNTRSVYIPISSSDELHKDLKRIDLEVTVAGQLFTKSFACLPNQNFIFTWDGKDAYGRPVQGGAPIHVRVGYVYPAIYLNPAPLDASFGEYVNRTAEGWSSNAQAVEATVWQEWDGNLTFWNNTPVGIGGWSLDVHHSYDNVNQVLNLGNGTSREVSGGHLMISTVAGTGPKGRGGDGGAATEAMLNIPRDIAIGPDGSIYISDTANCLIRRVGPDGVITTVAGIGSDEDGYGGFSGDGGPALEAELNLPGGIAVGPDGSIYIADTGNHRIRRIDRNGIITTVAGDGSYRHSGDGKPAVDASLNSPSDVAVGPDGSLYIADTENSRIRRVSPNGIITTVAGIGPRGFSGDGGPATKAQLNLPRGIAIGSDGCLYIADTINHRIRRVGTDGIITTVAGTGFHGYQGDGGLATKAQLNMPEDVTVGLDGRLYIADTENHCIRQVSAGGIITTVAGNGTAGYTGDGALPTEAQISNPMGVAVGPDGSLYIAQPLNNCIRGLVQPLPGSIDLDLIIPSEDGSELYIFDESGRHKRTVNAITGSDIFSFTYDEQGRLISIEDAFTNLTRIERDEQGHPTAIIAPGGQTTTLQVNEEGYLSTIACPLAKEKTLTYTGEGLLKTFSDHKGNVHRFTYDDLGLLIRDEGPANTGYTELTQIQLDNGYEVRVTTAGGRQSTYRVEPLPTGMRRVDTDPAGAVMTTEIMADGLRRVTYPDGTVATMVKGPDPRPGLGIRSPIVREFTVTTPAGLKSTVTRERTLTMDDPDDPFSITEMTDTINYNGKQYTYTYTINREAQTVTVTGATPEGRLAVSVLDWHGRLIRETVGNLEPVSYSYDEKGHLQEVKQSNLSLTYTYDNQHRLTSLEDASGSRFQYVYNEADLLTRTIMPGGQTYDFAYDANGNLSGVTMPSGVTHQLDYTEIDLPASYSPPNNGSYEKSYDQDRALTQLTLPSGRTVSFSSENGRITGLTYDMVSSIFGYSDTTGRIASIQRNPDGVNYDLAHDGSLLTQLTVSDAVYGRYTYGYGYDNDFNLVNLVLDGSPVALAYDLDGFLTRYGTFGITRDAMSGQPALVSDGVMNTANTYDSLGRLQTRTTTVNDQQVYNLELTYDQAGLIKTKRETAAGSSKLLTYTYDLNKQLTGVTGGSTPESYTYDVNGNRESYGARYDTQDRLTALNGAIYQFDADGYLTQRDSDTFSYTAQGELQQATLENGTKVTYTYDGLGRRVSRTSPDLSEQYLYGNPGEPFQVTACRDGSGNLSQYYYDETDCLIAINQGDDWYYVAADQQGTPRVITDADGQAVKVMEYDSFGRLLSDSNPSFRLPIGYAGGISDPDTELVHFGMRDYDPVAGRWTARDPVLFNGRQGNLYVYVSNNPVNLRDPSGLFCIGGSIYKGIGGGGQLCITGEGVSLCAEVGFGIGTSVEVSPFGGLASSGNSVGVAAGFTFAGIGPSGELSLDDCGSLSFTGGLSLGPVSQSATYDFLKGEWSPNHASVGGDIKDLAKDITEAVKPKMSASAKVYAKSCLQI
jgi:RHS repeat-associated protein